MKYKTDNLKVRIRSKLVTLNLSRHPSIKSYIAGVFDGEGNLYKTKQGYWRLCIANTFKPLMDWLIEMIPKSHVYIKHKNYKGRVHDCYYWSVNSQPDILKVLVLIKDYSIVKREIINCCLLELCKTYNQRCLKRKNILHL
jgi:hypothetical protein